MSRSAAEIIKEHGPFEGSSRVNGVTYDGRNVWCAVGEKLSALDPESGKVLRAIDVAAHAGTAFDGRHLFQIAESRIHKIDPQTGEVLEQVDMPPGVGVSGLESDGGDRFFCGGGGTGKLRVVRRPRSGGRTATRSKS